MLADAHMPLTRWLTLFQLPAIGTTWKINACSTCPLGSLDSTKRGSHCCLTELIFASLSKKKKLWVISFCDSFSSHFKRQKNSILCKKSISFDLGAYSHTSFSSKQKLRPIIMLSGFSFTDRFQALSSILQTLTCLFAALLFSLFDSNTHTQTHEAVCRRYFNLQHLQRRAVRLFWISGINMENQRGWSWISGEEVRTQGQGQRWPFSSDFGVVLLTLNVSHRCSYAFKVKFCSREQLIPLLLFRFLSLQFDFPEKIHTSDSCTCCSLRQVL